MGRRLIGVVQSRFVFWTMLIWLVVFMVAQVWPSSWWMDVRRVLVFDGIAGAEIVMSVDREINRPFIADWAVAVRRQADRGWVVHCAATGQSRYNVDSVLPDPLTLDWWTDGKCQKITIPGQYRISTIWTIRGENGLPDKIIERRSNRFEVAP